jgi:hypothetical protein
MEQLAEGISRAIICDGRIVIYHLTDMRRKTVDTWVTAILEQIQDCVDKQQPLITLNHFDGLHVAPTPYSNAKGKVISEMMAEMQGYTAFVMVESPHSIEMQVYMRRDMAKTRERQVFFSFDEGLDWLKSKLNTPCDETP